MNLGAAVLSYAAIAGILVVAMVAVAAKDKARGKAIFARENWNFLLALRPRRMLTGEMWLMSFAAAFITLCAGIIIVVFILPYGVAWAAAAIVVTIAALFGLMAKPLN